MGSGLRHLVAVTGLGVVSPTGQSVAEFRDSLLSGRSGAAPISIFDPASLPTRIAAEVKWGGNGLRDRKIAFGVKAADQAIGAATACGSAPAGSGGLSLGIGLELFSMDDAIAKRR